MPNEKVIDKWQLGSYSSDGMVFSDQKPPQPKRNNFVRPDSGNSFASGSSM